MKRLLLPLIMVFFFTGCVAPIDTFNKRLYAVEASYGAMLDLATLYQAEGRISVEEQRRLADAFDEYVQARRTLMSAMNVADSVTAENALLRMSQIIDAVRPLLLKGGSP